MFISVTRPGCNIGPNGSCTVALALTETSTRATNHQRMTLRTWTSQNKLAPASAKWIMESWANMIYFVFHISVLPHIFTRGWLLYHASEPQKNEVSSEKSPKQLTPKLTFPVLPRDQWYLWLASPSLRASLESIGPLSSASLLPPPGPLPADEDLNTSLF